MTDDLSCYERQNLGVGLESKLGPTYHRIGYRDDNKMDNNTYVKSCNYLNKDVLKHLSTLKYLSLYREYADIRLIEDSGDWAVLSAFPTGILSYDTATYPRAKKALFLNGTSEKLKHDLLASLKPDSYILRLNEDLDLSRYNVNFKISTGNTYLSYTCLAFDQAPGEIAIQPNPEIIPEAIDMFGRNGYTPDDLALYFSRGAQWFGLPVNGRLASACFVSQNYKNIWEIAGVHTVTSERRFGYAALVVRSALAYLLGRGLVPRYEAELKNLASHNLARHLNMKEFLTIRHYLLEAR